MQSRLLLVAALCACAGAARSFDRPVLGQTGRASVVRAKSDGALMRLRGGDAATVAGNTGLISSIMAQVAKEIANSNTSPAKFYGFVGAICNWFLGLSAVLDAAKSGPEVISLPMTLAMLAYSLLFGRWAGWDVTPKNYILAGSHIFNVIAQSNQLRRALQYKLDNGAKKEVTDLGVKAAGAIATVAAFATAAPSLKAMMPAGSYLASAGGPFTIHPWPPVTKVFLSMASLTDLHRPTDKISLPQYAALTLTAMIFSQYGLYVTPINIPLTLVNILLFCSSAWHLGRKIKADYLTKE